jgi:hypothetical protein
VIVHVMTTALREHYRLESIWGKDAVTYYVWVRFLNFNCQLNRHHQ